MKYQRILWLLALISILAACNKKENDASVQAAGTPSLTGTPAQQMNQLVQMGIAALNANQDPAMAAAAIQKLLTDYNVAGLRAAARAAKDAGQGASPAEIQAFKAAMAEFDRLAEEVGGKNSAVFNPAAEAWSRAWN